jgi:hypothetical protein
MDRFAAVGLDQGAVVVDTDDVTLGDPPGTESIDEPPSGPGCIQVTGEG